jgi:hypothetical protein
MQNKILNIIDKYRLFVFIALAILILGVLAIISTSHGTDEKQSTSDNTAMIEYEDSLIAVAESQLKVYYLDRGRYPLEFDELLDYVTIGADNIQNILELKDFEYVRRGDAQAYKISFTNSDSEHVVKQGNYQEDYQ